MLKKKSLKIILVVSLLFFLILGWYTGILKSNFLGIGLLLLCPLMHFFMPHGHGNEQAREHSHSSNNKIDK